MNLAHLNRQLITFCAVALLFLGSLFYFVSVAWRSKDAMQAKENSTQDLINSI